MTFHCDWTVCTSHAVAMDLFYFDLSTFLWKNLTSVLSFVTLVEDAINQLKHPFRREKDKYGHGPSQTTKYFALSTLGETYFTTLEIHLRNKTLLMAPTKLSIICTGCYFKHKCYFVHWIFEVRSRFDI